MYILSFHYQNEENGQPYMASEDVEALKTYAQNENTQWSTDLPGIFVEQLAWTHHSAGSLQAKTCLRNKNHWRIIHLEVI